MIEKMADKFYEHLRECKKCTKTCNDAITMQKWENNIWKHIVECENKVIQK